MSSAANHSGGAALDERRHLVEAIRALHPHRHEALFTEFLPRGYDMTRLGRPVREARQGAHAAKMLLGMLITFQDDLGDHPQFFQPAALDYLYGVSSRRPEAAAARAAIDVSQRLERALGDAAATLPHFALYERLLRFDLDQIAGANRYSALQRLYPGLGNVAEARHFGPFNMGMIAAGTLDLMALAPLADEALGWIREATVLGQRAGRISNVIATLEREQREADCTNEALIALQRGRSLPRYLASLEREHAQLLASIRRLGRRCDAVDLDAYADGVAALHALHVASKGHI